MILQLAKRIRPMMLADLELVLAWRNHPEVRRHMYTQHEISLDEHRQWFDRASRDPLRHLLIYEDSSRPLGFVNIHEIAPGGIADWGFYVAPDAPRGTGRALGDVAVSYTFVDSGLYKLCGQAIAFNKRSVQFHQALGFTQEGVLRQQYYDGKHYHDVLCFGLLAHEWKAQN